MAHHNSVQTTCVERENIASVKLKPLPEHKRLPRAPCVKCVFILQWSHYRNIWIGHIALFETLKCPVYLFPYPSSAWPIWSPMTETKRRRKLKQMTFSLWFRRFVSLLCHLLEPTSSWLVIHSEVWLRQVLTHTHSPMTVFHPSKTWSLSLSLLEQCGWPKCIS